MPDEEVFYDGRLPIKAFLGQHGLLYLMLVGWNVGLLIAWLRSLGFRIMITSQRLVVIHGLIGRNEEDIPLYRATDCSFRQSISGRLLGIGTITVIADDASSPRTEFPMVEPQRYKEILRSGMLAERRRMRAISMD